MKVGIITGYYSENSGTLLQALSLGNVIKKMGNEVVYINTKNKYSTHSIKLLFARIIKEALQFKFQNAIIAQKKYMLFENSIKEFDVIDIKNAEKEQIDVFVIGSDTVWNIEDRYFKKASKIYFPIEEKIKTISYAASVGNSKYESFQEYDYIRESLNNMKSIAVRDAYSQSVISRLTQKNIDIVVDPTILIETEELKKYYKKNNEDKDYMLVYTFNDFSENMVKDLKKFARQKNLNIISLGKKYDWSDKQITISIENFISYYYDAKYVITNTFHGNVFSIIFNKAFVCVDKKKNKINELLKEYDLSDRQCDEQDSIIEILNKNIDYEIVKSKLKKNRKKSYEYLEKNLKKGDINE